MGRTLINAADDWAMHRVVLAAKRKKARWRRIGLAMRSVLAVGVVAAGWVALNRFDQDISYCAANWLLHPHTDCWMSIYYGY